MGNSRVVSEAKHAEKPAPGNGLARVEQHLSHLRLAGVPRHVEDPGRLNRPVAARLQAGERVERLQVRASQQAKGRAAHGTAKFGERVVHEKRWVRSARSMRPQQRGVDKCV